jgi:hypothetical protein
MHRLPKEAAMTAAFALLLTTLSPLAAVLLTRLGAAAWKSSTWMRRDRKRLRQKRPRPGGRLRRVVPLSEPRLLELGFTRDELRHIFRDPAPTPPRACAGGVEEASQPPTERPARFAA